MKKITKTQIITIISLLFCAIWEFYVEMWAKTVEGPIIRVDLVIISPVLIILIVLSLSQLFSSK
ncbi:MAG: hypothetical protein FH753_15415 [Firmicutes bacterium]|nr:hypothetical protein [Bacillota bacterium]